MNKIFNKNILEVENSLIRKYTTLVSKYEDGISLAIGEPCININKYIIEETIKSLNNLECSYTNSQGYIELINAISKKENVLNENILVTFGSSEGIFISLLALIEKDDEVIVFTPCYPQYEPVIKFCGGTVKFVETLDTNCIPIKEKLLSVISDKTKVIILNTPSNPTGVSYDKTTLEMLVDVSKKYNFTILSDDVYEYINYTKKEDFKFDLNNTIKLKSFSKTYGMTGFRLGYILASEEVIKELQKIHSYLMISVPIFTQKAGVKALELETINYDILQSNLLYTIDFLKKNNLDYIDVNGGIFIFIKVPNNFNNCEVFCDELLAEYHVACVPGICFKAKGYFRLNFAVERCKLEEALIRIESFLNKEKIKE